MTTSNAHQQDVAPTVHSTATTEAHDSARRTTLLLLVGFFALQPLSTDFYLPSLPSLVGKFGTTVAHVQLTLSVFVAGFAIGQLVLGPVADRFGRRPVLLGGIVLYLLASIACATATSIDMLIAGRLLQAFGACAGVVGGRAIVRDRYAPRDGARVLAQANGLMSIVLLLGPIIGGFLEARFGFRAIFSTLAAIAAGLLALSWRRLVESTPQRNREATRLAPMLATYRAIATNRNFWAYTLAMTVSYGGIFAYLAGSSFVLVKVLGMSAFAYGLSFAVVVVGYVIGNLLCRRTIGALGIRRTQRRATLIHAAGGIAMVALALAGVQHPFAILLPQCVYTIAHGMTTPCSQAGAIAAFPNSAGAAAALTGFVQMAFAAGVGMVLGMTYNGTVYPLALSIGIAALCMATIVRSLVERWGGDADRH